MQRDAHRNGSDPVAERRSAVPVRADIGIEITSSSTASPRSPSRASTAPPTAVRRASLMVAPWRLGGCVQRCQRHLDGQQTAPRTGRDVERRASRSAAAGWPQLHERVTDPAQRPSGVGDGVEMGPRSVTEEVGVRPDEATGTSVGWGSGGTVDEVREHREPSDAVGDRMVEDGDQGGAAVGEGDTSVIRQSGWARSRGRQIDAVAISSRAWWSACPVMGDHQVVREVEAVVVDPHRSTGEQRSRLQPLTQPGDGRESFRQPFRRARSVPRNRRGPRSRRRAWAPARHRSRARRHRRA